ncbi:MAG: dihydropteroate synthase [Gemmatimonadales bacterium]
MRLTAIPPSNPAALIQALEHRGISAIEASNTALGLTPTCFIVEDIDGEASDLLLRAAHSNSVDALSGDGWILLSGAVARLAGAVRPGHSDLPDDLAESLGAALRAAHERPSRWSIRDIDVELNSPIVVGILNVTPDSFSDGGKWLDPTAALEHADLMIRHGAAMIDVGAESTRPGTAERLSPEREWERLDPILGELLAAHPQIPLSLDTVNAVTAERGLALGVAAINDVSGLRLDPELAAVCAGYDAGLILMHSRGGFSEMASYAHAQYDEIAAEVAGELAEAVARAVESGVRRDRIVIDPGLGFSKTPEQNWKVMRDLGVVAGLGLPVMVGPSRKRFLGWVTGSSAEHRDEETAAACVVACERGASLFRVHEVQSTRQALDIAEAAG